MNTTEIQTYQKPMHDEGVASLASAILSKTYKDYIWSLKTITELRKHPKKNKRKFGYAMKTKVECELFYKSKKFEIFTMGKSKPGTEIINDIQKTIGYVEVNN